MTQENARSYCPGCRELWETLPALHFCPTPDPPQDAHSVDFRGAAFSGGSPRQCVICDAASGVYFTTSPVCPAHASPVAFDQALREARAVRDTLHAALEELFALASFDYSADEGFMQRARAALLVAAS